MGSPHATLFRVRRYFLKEASVDASVDCLAKYFNAPCSEETEEAAEARFLEDRSGADCLNSLSDLTARAGRGVSEGQARSFRSSAWSRMTGVTHLLTE
jgi:hypothetical protein